MVSINNKYSNLAPILIFVYKRLWHTQKTIESVLNNEEAKHSKIYIFSDASKNELDRNLVSEVREYIKTIKGFGELEIIEREKNLGLAKSIISGVTEVLSKSDRVIVLEDDMVVSKYFLDYMNQALDLYEDEPKVACIHAWNYPLGEDVPETFFLRGSDCWGWATWRRAWNVFEEDGQKLLNSIQDKKLEWEFDRKGAYPYTQMLIDQIAGKNDSWAIRWHASAFLADMYCLHPGKSLLQNIGLDGSGTHSGKSEQLSPSIYNYKFRLHKLSVIQNDKMILRIKDYTSSSKVTFIKRFMNKIKKLGLGFLKNL